VACVAGCRAAPDGAQPLTGESEKYLVQGEFSAVPLDRIDRITVVDDHIVLQRIPTGLDRPLPPDLDPAKPARHWALVSDAHVNGRHLFVFTEAESVTDVSLSLPDGDAPLHFDVFAEKTGGGEVLVFASGDATVGPPSFWGWVSIRAKTGRAK
jgi:hypothetical protein